MNILIVDDNNSNRMIMKYLLEDYAKNNSGIIFGMQEARDGFEALQMCKENSYDIVFMDIMMPNMDGVEATKRIREIDKKTMIIAVSAMDDTESKKLILNNGAEDYISKPIIADMFISRMDNYITLVESRKSKKSNIEKVNLFSDKIYKRHTKFIINSEDSLSEFWEFFLLNVRNKSENLSDIVRAIVSIADVQLRLSIHSGIYIEESDEAQYFTLTDIDAIPLTQIELIIKKNNLISRYLIEDGKISFELKKNAVENDAGLPSAEIQNAHAIIQKEEKTIPAEKIASPLVLKKSENLQIFNYMEEEDLYDLEEYAGKLNSLLLVVGNGDVSEEEIADIYTYLDKIAGILAVYSEVYVISKALTELSYAMSTHISEFIKNSEALGPMCKAFSNDISNWIEMSFHTGAPSVQFMNDTIVVNCQTISGMLKMDEVPADGGEDFDDIFDF
ncbi:MAG: response regulator [Campylobacterales bacterium]|nr:response regulator [Campylobacterales bacterium]